MSDDFHDSLLEVLRADDRLVSDDGAFLRNRAVELANSLDEQLLRALLGHDVLRERFFRRIDEVSVFDVGQFTWVVSNREFLPDSYTRFRNAIGLADGDGRLLSKSNRVQLVWPYKDCILEGGQTKEDEKRSEIFWNESLAPQDVDRLLEPKAFTQGVRVSEGGEELATSVADGDNLIVKGNNLLVMSSLMERYREQVRLIYIDPPFNTGSDEFEYNDRFSTSAWLTFMKNRLEMAHDLLSENGAIFLHISDVRVNMIRLVLDEIFGPENFVNIITVKTRSPSGFQVVNAGVYEVAEYIYVYAKDKTSWTFNPQYVASEYDENYKFEIEDKTLPPEKWVIRSIKDSVAEELGYEGPKEARAKLGKEAFKAKVAEYALDHRDSVFRKTAIQDSAGKETVEARDRTRSKLRDQVLTVEREGDESRYVLNGEELAFYFKKVRTVDGVEGPTNLMTNIWTDISYEGIANEGGVTLRQGKKPEKLLRRIIQLATDEPDGDGSGDLVCDFFLGSGTTCAVAHKLGRRYLGIEQLGYVEEKAVPRLKKVIEGEASGISSAVGWEGGGSFVYTQLAELNEAYMARVQGATNTEDLIATWNELKDSGLISFRVRPEAFDEGEFNELTLAEQRAVLAETLEKNLLYVNRSDLEDEDLALSEEDKTFTRSLYGMTE